MADEVIETFLKERLLTTDPIKFGVWNSNLRECKNMADQYGIPLIAIWSNYGCGHCKILERAFMSDAFKNWMKTVGYIFCFVCNRDEYGLAGFTTTKDDSNNGTIIGNKAYSYYNFCKNPPVNKDSIIFPFVKFYWYVDGVKKINQLVHGDKLSKQQGIHNGTYDRAGEYCIDYIQNKTILSQYIPDLNKLQLPTVQVNVGEWTTDLDKAKQYAEEMEIPLIAVWSLETNCQFCDIFQRIIEKTEFINWYKDIKPVMVFIKAKNWNDHTKELEWISGNLTAAPFVCVYWYRKDKAVKIDRFSGRSTLIGGSTPEDLINKIKQTIGNWSFAQPIIEEEVIDNPVIWDNVISDNEGSSVETSEKEGLRYITLDISIKTPSYKKPTTLQKMNFTPVIDQNNKICLYDSIGKKAYYSSNDKDLARM